MPTTPSTPQHIDSYSIISISGHRILSSLGKWGLNLLNNAWASCKDMENPKLSIETFCTEKIVQIRVSDNGLGIPPEFYEDIIEAFVSTRGHELGMGLGLTISRSFIQSMGGEIELVKAGAVVLSSSSP